jgi:intein/homing endonuclease
LSKFGKSFEKYIPQKIKNLNPEYIKIFLERYSMGDGSIRNNKWKEGNFRDEETYFTSSKKMADDIGELILKAGYRPSFYLQKAKGVAVKHKNGVYFSNHDIWIIRKCYSQYAMVTYRKKINYNDNVYCLELEKNHIMLVRRNGKVVWSGNCMCHGLSVLGE